MKLFQVLDITLVYWFWRHNLSVRETGFICCYEISEFGTLRVLPLIILPIDKSPVKPGSNDDNKSYLKTASNGIEMSWFVDRFVDL